jgi:ACR3 family arsenite transporter
MSETAVVVNGDETRKAPAIGKFERYLTLWVALCIVVGIGLGQTVPSVFHALGAATVAEVNLPIAVLVWLMIVPMLLKIDLAALGQVREHWRGIAVTVGINWLVKPFSMALLGWLFIGYLFRPFLPAGQIDAYIAGLILLAAAPCTAMVFVWSNLVEGEPHFTLSQVALNDTIMVVAFAPLVALLLGLSSITVPWNTLILSVMLYIVVPVIVAQLWRRLLLTRGGQASLARTLRALAPLSLSALLLTLVLLFGLQGEQIIRQPLVIALLAVPILIQVYFNAGLAYWLNRRLGVAWCVAGPSALIGASNFFELAVATAIALFGFQSGAALATVVGVLVEVPVMLSVVHLVRRSRGWYERARIGQDLIWIADGAQTMQSKNPFRHHTPDDDPEAGTPGTGEDVCPECNGTGKQLDKETGKPTDKPCERCDGTGIIVQGVG